MTTKKSRSKEKSAALETERPLAFLVDGENASAELIDEMLREVAKYGNATIRRVYGDWSSPRMMGWRNATREHSLKAVQQHTLVAGKNAADSALIIDAMDFLHLDQVKGFCLVSSDSDFTPLATKIREHRLFVMGIGEEKTPEVLRKAYDVFVLAENLRPSEIRPRHDESVETTWRARRRAPDEATDLLIRAFDTIASADGNAHLAALGNALLKLDPSFDARTYGRPRLLELIQALPDVFETERPPNAPPAVVMVRRIPERRVRRHSESKERGW
jgi:uncharacterized LabA/DUF88 family protein